MLNAIEKRVERVYSDACSTLTGLTAMVIDIAYLYTYEAPSPSQSHSQTSVRPL